MNSYDTMKYLNDIAATSSRTEKERILEQAVTDPFFVEVIKWTCDPFITFGVTPPKVETEGVGGFDLESTRVWEMLHALKNRDITGNAAKDTVLKTLMSLGTDSAELLWRILSKDLRCGVTSTSINKVLPGTIPTFDVMLAHKFEDKRIKEWPVAVEPKLDGVRVICLVKDGTAKFFSRTGKPFPAVEHLGEQVAQMVKATHAACLAVADQSPSNEKIANYLKDVTVALDGEIVSGSFNKTVGDVRRKNEDAVDAEYHIFDALPLAHFLRDERVIKVSYKTRRIIAETLVQHAPDKKVLRTTPRYYANTVDEIQEWYQKFRDRGLEGAIVKPLDAVYTKARSHAWLKMKNEESEDLRVVGAFEGTGKYEGMLGGLVVDRDGVQVRVGGGFSDAQREEFWEAFRSDDAMISSLSGTAPPEDMFLIGRLIEVEFHEVTPDGSLRHPRFVRFRDDKDERQAA